MHTCLSALLQPLKQAGKDGVRLAGPDGCERLVFPRLFGYIADIPEVAAVGGLKGHRSMHPCDQCLVGAAFYLEDARDITFLNNACKIQARMHFSCIKECTSPG